MKEIAINIMRLMLQQVWWGEMTRRGLLILVGMIASFLIASQAVAGVQFQQGDIYIGAFSVDSIYKVDPVSFAVTIFADSSDGLSGLSALAFTPDGTKLLSSNFSTSTVIEFDVAGNGSVILDSLDGLNGPFGENGLAFDVAGNLFVSNFRLSQILGFPGGVPPGMVFADFSDGIVSPDGLAFAANGDLLVANRGGGNVLRIDPSGNASVFDTLPGDPFSIAIRNNGDIYVATFGGNVFRYVGGIAANRVLLTTVTSSSSNPALQLNLAGSLLYYTSFRTGNLVTIDPDTGSQTQVIAPGGVANGLAIAVAPLNEVEVEKDYRFTDVCFERDNDLDGLFSEDPVEDLDGDGVPDGIDNDGDGLVDEDDIDCPDGTSLGDPLPTTEVVLPDGTVVEKFLLEAVTKKNGDVSSYNPGQYYAVSTVEVLTDLDTLWIIERYGDCTEGDSPISALNPKMGTGGGNVVLVQVIDGVAFQIADSNSDNVVITDDDNNGVPDNAEAHLGNVEADSTFLLYVKFKLGLKGKPIPDEPDNMCENENAALTEVDGPEVSATADLIVLPK